MQGSFWVFDVFRYKPQRTLVMYLAQSNRNPYYPFILIYWPSELVV